MVSRNEEELVKSIKNITLSILNNYNYLRNLELTNSEEGEEFKRILNELRHDISLEESLYKSLGNDYIVIQNILKLLDQKRVYKKPLDDINASMDNNRDLVVERIVRRLADSLFSNPKVIFKTRELEDNIYPLNKANKMDILNTLLTIINIYLNDPKYKYMYDYLTKIKYNLAFLNPDIEQDLLKNNFHINPIIYWSSDIVASINQIPNKISRFQRHLTASNILEEGIDYLVTNYQDVYDKEKYEMMQIIIRAMALFYTEDSIQAKKDDYTEIFKEFPFDPSLLFLQISIMNSLNFYNSDRSLVREVSLTL